jgi:hypothetical protein
MVHHETANINICRSIKCKIPMVEASTQAYSDYSILSINVRSNLHVMPMNRASKWLMISRHTSTRNVPDTFFAGYLGGIIPSL